MQNVLSESGANSKRSRGTPTVTGTRRLLQQTGKLLPIPSRDNSFEETWFDKNLVVGFGSTVV